MEDVCFVYEPETASQREGMKLKQIWKGPENNLYTYINRRLICEVDEGAVGRLRAFLDTTFYDNAYALKCTIAGISIALVGENVDRAFWTIGGGGVGQSLFTTLINSALSPMHTFFDCTSLYQDDELRKTLEHIVGYKVLTSQEGTEGGIASIRNLRQGLYKKICSGDPISCRLPYAKSSKMVSTRGMLRFELNQPLTFNNVKEAQWDSIYRRSLVMRMKGKFIPAEEYRSLSEEQRQKSGFFIKGDTLKSFLESGPAASAFFNIIYNFMNEHSIDERRSMIDDYARNEGATWDVMRPACNLEKVAPPTSIDRPVF